MWEYLASAIGGVAIGILLEKLIAKHKIEAKIKFANALEIVFGEPLYVNSFSLLDVTTWLKKTAIMKARPELLKAFEHDLDFSEGIEKALVIVIYDTSTNEKIDSLLVKYEKLDSDLEAALDKGNGVMVVEV